MHQRIVTTVRLLRQDLACHLDDKAIHDACRQAGHRWRDCILTPAAIVHWFIIQVLHGNTALEHISLLAGRAFTGAAYCLARSNLPLRVYEAVLRLDQGPCSRHTCCWSLAGPSSHLFERRFVVFHARYTRTASALRSAWKPKTRLRVSGGQYLGDVPRRHRATAGNSSCSVANPRNGLYRIPSLDPPSRGCLGG